LRGIAGGAVALRALSGALRRSVHLGLVGARDLDAVCLTANVR
jgi:hypothetical protein